MKKTTIKQTIISTLLVFMGLTSCTAGFPDINTNPYEADAKILEGNQYKVSAFVINLQGGAAVSNPWRNQFVEQLMGANWCGYGADANPGFYGKNFAIYKPESSWIGKSYMEDIPLAFQNYSSLKGVTKDEVLLAVGEILKVAILHKVTDTYGPIPYTKIGENGALTTALDAQEIVYKEMFKELNHATEILSKPENISLSFSVLIDKMYAGNVRSWIKFANSLKLRLAIRIVYADPALAQQMAEEAIKHPVGVFTANTDNAQYSNFGKDGNPLYLASHVWNGGDIRVAADITSYMNGYKDPRASKYFISSKLDDVENGFYGLRRGAPVPPAITAQAYTNFNITATTPVLIMGAAEVYFLRAEGALRGWSMGGTAEEFYKKGVQASFAQWGAEGADTYLADKESKPDSYKDPLGDYNYSGATSVITIAWDATADFEKNLERIITQKWIANFPFLNIESWSEYRRTGYPILFPVVVNNSSGEVDTNLGARRLKYPQQEITSNETNVNYAIANYLKGPDNMGTRVWWDKKK
ncbi:MAG: RagB/SusD family nutrient uptake outer membrane protein [Bacteroidia bacterium]|nr:RagB/SusD family nutrient uptake outer membrane protein [Bacteroidia bacterium]